MNKTEQAIAMVATGSSVAQIAKHFGVSWSRAKQLCDAEYYARHKARMVQWQRDHKGEVAERARKYRSTMTDDQREHRNAMARAARQRDPSWWMKSAELSAKYRSQPQYLLASKLRSAVHGYSSRQALMFGPLMAAITGLTQDQFTELFKKDGVFDHIVPLCAFDLLNPAHVVRANHQSNLRIVPAKVNERKGGRNDCADVMALEWSGNPDALTQAHNFIARYLKRLERIAIYPAVGPGVAC